jgi:DNA/RNA-binding domain of Phe-tRNA-synthetase-like protein
MTAVLTPTDAWRAAWPGAAAGLLVMDKVANPPAHPELDRRKAALETALRERYGRMTRAELLGLHSLQAYANYYRRFKKTYHVQLQLESVALKGKGLPRVAALVEVMFMAELENHLLTAGHDAVTVQLPIQVDVATEGESYVLLTGRPQPLTAGDMVMRDGAGVISSVLHGPDGRSRLRAETTRAVFAVYAPPGIGAELVAAHLRTIAANVVVIAPAAKIVSLEVC